MFAVRNACGFCCNRQKDVGLSADSCDDMGQLAPAIFTTELAAERHVKIFESELALRRFSIHLATVTCKGLKGNHLIPLLNLAQKH